MRLQARGCSADSRAFVFIATTDGLTGSLQQGTFILRKNMTPDQLVEALLAPPAVPFVDIALRTGLRLEQITAKLETLTAPRWTPPSSTSSSKSPPAELLADYPWLKTVLRRRAEGRLARGLPVAGDLSGPARHDARGARPADARQVRAECRTGADGGRQADRGLNFYQVIALASIVEKEAQLDEEKPLIAGVYSNRLDPKKWPTGLLQSDPTIFYVHDTLELAKLKVRDWTKYVFWAPIKGGLTDEELPPELAGYNTYTSAGLPPGPICTPTLASIDAALEPDTKDGYMFFVAKGDGSKTTAFAKTLKQHQANVKKYVKPT